MKKTISILLLCAMLVTTLASCAGTKGLLDLDHYEQECFAADVAYTSAPAWDGTTSDKSWYNASASTFYLEDGADLKGFIDLVYSQNVTFAGKTVQLKGDINLGNKEWKIPTSNTYFQGTFDGAGFTIGGFTMTCTTSNQSLLGSIGGGAVVKNLKVEDGKIKLNASASSNAAASVVARIVTVKGKSATVEGVSSSCTISYPSSAKAFLYVGGIVGMIEGDGEAVIKSCSNSGAVTSQKQYVGGILGGVTGKVSKLTVSDCTNTGAITTYECLGGIIGAANACTNNIQFTITNCTNTGSVTVTSSSTAGIAAGILGRMNATGGSLSITGCTNKGMVSYNGTLVGRHSGLCTYHGIFHAVLFHYAQGLSQHGQPYRKPHLWRFSRIYSKSQQHHH